MYSDESLSTSYDDSINKSKYINNDNIEILKTQLDYLEQKNKVLKVENNVIVKFIKGIEMNNN